MSRLEELVGRAADGEASEGEHDELEDLLARDEQAFARYALTLEVEAALRGLAPVDVSARVGERLARRQEEQVVRGVVHGLRSRPPPAWRTQPRVARRRVWVMPLALAACLVIVAGGLFAWRRRPAPVATIAGGRGGVLLRAESAPRPLAGGLELRPGDRIETGENAAVVTYGRARLELAPRTVLAFEPDRTARVDRGGLSVKAEPGEPLVLVTAHARVSGGGRIALLVTAARTRVDVAEGRVRFERLRDGSAVDVTAGQHAQSSEPEPTPPPAPAATPAPGPVVLRAFDFEDGSLPRELILGKIVPGPPRAGNHHAVEGTRPPFVKDAMSIEIASYKPRVLYYSPRTVVAFDYWLGAEGVQITLKVWNGDQRANYYRNVRDVVRETWGHAEVRIADLVPFQKGRSMNEGDAIDNVHILGTGAQPPRFFVDNLRLLEYPIGDLPQTTGGAPPP